MRKVLTAIFYATMSAAPIVAQTVIFEEDFESGTPSSDWEIYRADEEAIQAVAMADAPATLDGGGSYVGMIWDVDVTYAGSAHALAGEKHGPHGLAHNPVAAVSLSGERNQVARVRDHVLGASTEGPHATRGQRQRDDPLAWGNTGGPAHLDNANTLVTGQTRLEGVRLLGCHLAEGAHVAAANGDALVADQYLAFLGSRRGRIDDPQVLRAVDLDGLHGTPPQWTPQVGESRPSGSTRDDTRSGLF